MGRDSYRVGAHAIERTDSLYESKGYYLAKIAVDSTVSNGKIQLAFKIDEGRRLAISGIRINGNRSISDREIVSVFQVTNGKEKFIQTLLPKSVPPFSC